MNMNIGEYCTWLRGEIDNYQTYHHHKETMAWTATAFYLPSVIGLAYAASLIPNHSIAPIIFTLLLILLPLLVIGFVSMQFKMRAIAADYTNGLRRVLSRLCSGNPPLSSSEVEVVPDDGFPYFVRCEIQPLLDNTKKLRSWAGYFNAIKLFVQFKWGDIDNRIRTELTSYASIIIVSLIAIAIVWKPL